MLLKEEELKEDAVLNDTQGNDRLKNGDNSIHTSQRQWK